MMQSTPGSTSCRNSSLHLRRSATQAYHHLPCIAVRLDHDDFPQDLAVRVELREEGQDVVRV